MDLIRGINCYKHSADFHCRPKGNIPRRYVCRPNCYMISLFDTHTNKGPGKIIHVFSELAVCSGIIAGGISECILIRELVTHTIQHLGKSQINQSFFGPYIFSIASSTGLQSARHVGRTDVLLHVVYKMREYDSGGLQIGHIAFEPLQRNVPLIIDRTERRQKVRNRKIPFSHHSILYYFAVHNRIFDMGIFNIRAKILNRLLWLFSAKSIRMVHIPKSSHRITFYRVEHGA